MSGEGVSDSCNSSVRSARGHRYRKRPFSDHLKTVILVLAMVIRIVMTIASKKMTIAATPKTILVRAENSDKKGEKRPHFVKGCYFYGSRCAQKWLQWPRKSSWLVEFLRKLCPEKRALRLYIYTLCPQVLHKYTAACKGFSHSLRVWQWPWATVSPCFDAALLL